MTIKDNGITIEITESNREYWKGIYLGSVCIAKNWLVAAQLKEDGSAEVFQRIFDYSLEKYNQYFGNPLVTQHVEALDRLKQSQMVANKTSHESIDFLTAQLRKR